MLASRLNWYMYHTAAGRCCRAAAPIIRSALAIPHTYACGGVPRLGRVIQPNVPRAGSHLTRLSNEPRSSVASFS